MSKNLTSLSAIVLFCLYGCQEPNQTQQIDLEELTITEIHKAYKNGDYNSETLVAAFLKDIDSLDSKINALTTINTNAITQAKALDEEYKKTGVLRPLHGIPIIVKDNINTIGLPTTAGSFALKDFIPEDDAFIIKQLKGAGAIILAKSNMAEWAFSAMHTKSSTGGTTRNPYNLNHVPAGSSGGTAAASA
jgi:Asp-tRNA(Asn)/Glu-tRNA(Gln) amidotransferase A subunit family amidase